MMAWTGSQLEMTWYTNGTCHFIIETNSFIDCCWNMCKARGLCSFHAVASLSLYLSVSVFRCVFSFRCSEMWGKWQPATNGFAILYLRPLWNSVNLSSHPYMKQTWQLLGSNNLSQILWACIAPFLYFIFMSDSHAALQFLAQRGWHSFRISFR